MTRRKVRMLTVISTASANIGSPVGEPRGPKNETKAQGGWTLSDGSFAVEPLDPRVPGVDYRVVRRKPRQGRSRQGKSRQGKSKQVRETKPKKPQPTWNPDNWWGRQPESPQRSGVQRWSEAQTESLVELAFQDEVKDWVRIASEVGRPVNECQAEWRELASLQLNAKPSLAWTVKQTTELMRFVDDYGMTDWIRISHFLQHTPEACIAKHAELVSSRQASQSGPVEASSSKASNRRGVARPHVSNKRRRNDEDDQPEQLSPKKAKRSRQGTTSATEDALASGVGQGADRDEPAGLSWTRSGKRKLDGEPAETGPRVKKLRLNGPVPKDPPAQTSGISSPASGVPVTMGTSQQVSSQQHQQVSQSRRVLRLRPPKAPATGGSTGAQEGKQAPDHSSSSTPIGKRVHDRQRGQRLQDPQAGSSSRSSKATATVKPSRLRQRGQNVQTPQITSAGAGEKRRRVRVGDNAGADRFEADVARLEDEVKALPPSNMRTSKRLQLERTKAS